MIKCCPKCRARNSSSGRFYSKYGCFTPRHNHQPVPRYRCRLCHAHFSSRSFSNTFREHKPKLDPLVFNALCSGMTFRRTAKVLRVSRNTVTAKFHKLAAKARRLHVRALQQRLHSMTAVEFDEMESYQGSRLNMLSIPLAVQPKSGFILDARVARMRPKGMLARKHPNAWRRWSEDTRKEACGAVLRRVQRLSGGGVLVRCDAKPQYPGLIRAYVKGAQIELCRRGPDFPESRRFTGYLNHAAAKLRADLARLRRRTWACTRRWQNLQQHLYLYMAWSNGYRMFG
jgi:transposase-like protein